MNTKAVSKKKQISKNADALQKAILTEYIPFLSRVLLEQGIIQSPLRAVVRKGKEHFVFDVCYKDDGQVKKSETTDGYSVTYVTEVSDGTDWTALLGQKMYQICRRYLLHTGLLSRSLKC